jgi:hypothetical protein
MRLEQHRLDPHAVRKADLRGNLLRAFPSVEIRRLSNLISSLCELGIVPVFTGIRLSEPVFGKEADANLAKPFMRPAISG